MRKLFFISFILLFNLTARGQIITINISQHEANDLTRVLSTTLDDRTRIDILLRLASYSILRDEESKTNLNNATAFIKQASGLNSKMTTGKHDGYIMLVESSLNRKKGNIENGKKLINKAIQFLQTAHDEFHLTVAYLELANYYDSNDSAQSAEFNSLKTKILLQLTLLKSQEQKNYCIRAIKYFYQTNLKLSNYQTKLIFLDKFLSALRQINNIQNELWGRKEVAYVHLYQGKRTETEIELLKLLRDHKVSGYPEICLTYDLLAGLYSQAANYKKALYYSFEAIKSVRTSLDSSNLPNLYGRIAGIYSKMDDTEQSKVWNTKGLNTQILLKQTANIYYNITNIIDELITDGKPKEALDFIKDKIKKYPPSNDLQREYAALGFGECYAALHENDLAEKYYLEMISLVNKRIMKKEISSDISADLFIGMFYLDTKQYSKAEKYLKNTVKEWPISGASSRDLFESKFMFKLDSASGKYLSAIGHLKRIQKIKDSTLNAAKSKQIEELQISYETDQKKKDIKLLQDEKKLQQVKLQHAENSRNWIIAGATMLFLLLGVSYNRYLQKRKSNKQLRVQREEITAINLDLNKFIVEKDRLLKEKDWLLKEVHHRVKNNLHTVICLLESQAAYLQDDALKAIESSQHRIYAMSLIHQKLYQSDDIKTIDMSIYLSEFITYLNDSFGTQRKVRFHLDTEPIQLNVSQAIPIALIINEAVTNSIKHAFPEIMTGIITLHMFQANDDEITLVIADNGIGIDSAITNIQASSLGLKLINGLSQDINARLNIENEKGTRITVNFNVDRLNNQNNLVIAINETYV